MLQSHVLCMSNKGLWGPSTVNVLPGCRRNPNEDANDEGCLQVCVIAQALLMR